MDCSTPSFPVLQESTELKRVIRIIIVGDFSVLLLVINRTSRQEISEGVGELNNIINQLYLADILE